MWRVLFEWQTSGQRESLADDLNRSAPAPRGSAGHLECLGTPSTPRSMRTTGIGRSDPSLGSVK